MDLWILRLAKLKKRIENPDQRGEETFYEAFFEDKDLQAYDVDIRMRIRRQTVGNALARHCPHPSNVLDVGCGLGELLAGLDPGYTLHGVDIAARSVRVCIERLGPNAVVKKGSVFDLPFGDGSMGVAICLEVLEHVPDDQSALAEIGRVVRPGGILVLSVPHTYYWPEYLELIGHYRHYDRVAVEHMLERRGFTVVEHLPNYPNWHRAYVNGYVRTRVVAETLGRILGTRSPYDLRVPWRSRRELERLEDQLQPLLEADARLPYSGLSTSTFVVARRNGQ